MTASTIVRALVALLLLTAVPWASAQEKWPSKPIHIVVPFPTGGSTDLLARRVAQALGERVPVPVIVENKPGAAGIIGSEYVAQQPADGYTFVMGGVSTHVLAPIFHPGLKYDPIADFTPITIVGNFPYVLVASPSLPATNARELVQLARSQPVTIASNGTGTGNHLLAVRFAQAAGAEFVQVPYKGSGPAVIDLMGGHVNAMFNDVMTSYPNVKAGKLKAFALTASQRSPLLPDVPTLAEAGFPDVKADNWIGLLAPGHMAPALARQVSDEFIAVLKTPALREFVRDKGGEESAVAPAEFAEIIRSGGVMWRKVVQDANIKIE
jgi:tripartite-type tricarboxylate transporter receptor subunit TctC